MKKKISRNWVKIWPVQKIDRKSRKIVVKLVKIDQIFGKKLLKFIENWVEIWYLIKNGVKCAKNEPIIQKKVEKWVKIDWK